jgi:hypothetical protein
MNALRSRTIATLLDDVMRTLRLRPQPIADAVAFAQFLKEQSAFVSQKTVVEYCRIKAGVRWQKLFGEKDFKVALEVSRWISMRAVLCDLAVIVEGYLRDAARPHEMALANALGDMILQILSGYDRGPAWQQESRETVDELRRRLARTQMAAPLTPDRVARTSGGIVFDALPVHSMLRAHDREVIVNNIRFGVMRFWEDLNARAKDRQALAASVLAAGTGKPHAG